MKIALPKITVPNFTPQVAHLTAIGVAVCGVIGVPTFGAAIDEQFHTHLGTLVAGAAAAIATVAAHASRPSKTPAPAGSAPATADVVLVTSPLPIERTPTVATVVTVATPTTPTFEGQVADAIIAAVEQNKTAIIAAISSAEGGVETFLTGALNSVKPSGAILPLVWSYIKPAIVAELVSIETANPGTVIFALLDAEAHAFAASLGG